MFVLLALDVEGSRINHASGRTPFIICSTNLFPVEAISHVSMSTSNLSVFRINAIVQVKTLLHPGENLERDNRGPPCWLFINRDLRLACYSCLLEGA